MAKIRHLDVYYVEIPTPDEFCPAFADIRRSWDGSLYVETNVLSFAGPHRHVLVAEDGRAAINWEALNCGVPYTQVALFMEG